MEGLGTERAHVEIGLEAVDLPAEGVALDRHVHESRERMGMAGHVRGDEDRTRAGPPHRHARRGALLELGDDPVVRGELADRRALAARDDERVDLVELLGAPHVDRLDAEVAQRREVLGEVPLETEDAGARGRR